MNLVNKLADFGSHFSHSDTIHTTAAGRGNYFRDDGMTQVVSAIKYAALGLICTKCICVRLLCNFHY
jgi:hypothetical protein